MAFEIAYFLSLGYIEHFDLSVTIAYGDAILVTEGDGANIIIDLTGLVEPRDFR
jgi:hypothetical protein